VPSENSQCSVHSVAAQGGRERVPYVFPSPKLGPILNLQKVMARLRKETGIEFRFHDDVRRAAASHMTAIGLIVTAKAGRCAN